MPFSFVPRLARVALVHDLATTPDEVHLDQDVLHQIAAGATRTQVPDRDVTLGHEVADDFGADLASCIEAMGLRAEHVSRDTSTSPGDVKVVGAFAATMGAGAAASGGLTVVVAAATVAVSGVEVYRDAAEAIARSKWGLLPRGAGTLAAFHATIHRKTPGGIK